MNKWISVWIDIWIVAICRSRYQWLVYRIFQGSSEEKFQNEIGASEIALAYREWRQSIENMVLTRCRIVLSWWRFGSMVVALSRAAGRFLLPSPRLVDLERNHTTTTTTTTTTPTPTITTTWSTQTINEDASVVLKASFLSKLHIFRSSFH